MLVYRTLQNQFNIIHGLVNHCSEALQDKWIFFFCGNVIENMNFEPYSGQFDIHKVVLSSQQNPHCLLVSQCWCTKVGDQKQQEQCIL